MELFEIGFISVQLVDLLDIGIAAFLIYKLYEALRGSQAMRVLWVVLVFFVAWKLVDLLNMVLLKTLLNEVVGLGAVALVILFAPEIRRFLTNISRNTVIDRVFRGQMDKDARGSLKLALIDSIVQLKQSGSGALIVLAGNQSLKEVIESGDPIDALASERLLYSIFQKYSPLHDGAVIIDDGRVLSARCILPISRSTEVPASMGLRHRAALGLAEQTDAFVIVLSEERQQVSLAFAGKIDQHVSLEQMEERIESFLTGEAVGVAEPQV